MQSDALYHVADQLRILNPENQVILREQIATYKILINRVWRLTDLTIWHNQTTLLLIGTP